MLQAGLQAAARGDLGEAVRQFRALTRQAPGNADAWHNLATAMLQLGRSEQCLRMLLDALTQRPAAKPAAWTLSRLLEATAQPVRATRRSSARTGDILARWPQ